MYKKLFFGLLIFSVCMQMYASRYKDYESAHAAYVRRQAAHVGAIVGITQSFLRLQQMNLPIDDEHDVFLIENSPNGEVSVVSVMIGYKESLFAQEEVSALPGDREDYTKNPEVKRVVDDIATTYAQAMQNNRVPFFGCHHFPVALIRNDEQHLYNCAQKLIGVCY